MIRQTDSIRVTDKCYNKTMYYQNMSDENGGYKYLFRDYFPTCIYLESGKCVLNCCVRRENNGFT